MRNKQIDEALARLKMLGLHSNVTNDFLLGIINKSEGGGFLYWLNDKEEEIVKEFEKQYDAVVYHCISTPTNFGDLLSMLYVSAHPDEWEYDRKDLGVFSPLSYVYNKSCPEFSELGSIGIKPQFGGLIRTA